MALLPIVYVPDPVLRHKAKPVERVTKRIQKLIRDMADTMYDAEGVGLAAPQVGVSEQVIVADDGEGLVCLINPRITSRDGSDVDVEGCLSIPNIVGYVERASAIDVEGLDERGRAVRMHLEGMLARIIQHEVDHLHGVLITDIATGIRRTDEDDTDGEAEDSGDSETVGKNAAPDAAADDETSGVEEM